MSIAKSSDGFEAADTPIYLYNHCRPNCVSDLSATTKHSKSRHRILVHERTTGNVEVKRGKEKAPMHDECDLLAASSPPKCATD